MHFKPTPPEAVTDEDYEQEFSIVRALAREWGIPIRLTCEPDGAVRYKAVLPPSRAGEAKKYNAQIKVALEGVEPATNGHAKPENQPAAAE